MIVLALLVGMVLGAVGTVVIGACVEAPSDALAADWLARCS